MHLSLILGIFGLVTAKKQAVYSSNYSTAYLLSDNDLYTLVLSGETENSDTISKELKQLQAPSSVDSTLVIDSSDILYAVYGTGCGTALEIQQYNVSSNSWIDLDSSPQGYYNLNSTAWYDSDSNSILVYGGLYCNSTISQDFFKFDIEKQQWSETSANPMPREMAYASTISISKESTLVLGGRTNDGWLSMQQVAIWQYGGWSYYPISNYTGIDSRDDPFLLPMWNNSQSTTVDTVLVVGGTVAGRDASPSVLALKFDSSQGWHWTTTTVPDNDVMLTVYNAVYSNNAIYAPSGSSLESITPSKAVTSTATTKKGLNVGSIAALSTIIPLIFIILACVGVWMWWRRRKQRTVFQPRQSQLVDNQSLDMDNFPDFSYPPIRQKDRRVFPDTGRHHQKDNSTSEYAQNDVQFLVNRTSTNLRVVNPDVDQSSVSSYGTLTSDSGPLLEKDQRSVSSADSDSTIGSLYHHHRATGSCDLSEMMRTTSRSSSGSRRIVSNRREFSSQSFDFQQ